MNIRKFANKGHIALLSGSILLSPLGVAAGGPIGASLQTEGHAGEGVEGGSGAALISVVVTTENGKPATNFGNSGSDLPPGWALLSGFDTVEGCGLVPTEFTNVGGGVYTIQVAPGCGSWVAGEHHYVVVLDKDAKFSGKKLNFRGRTLGSLEIPEAPVL